MQFGCNAANNLHGGENKSKMRCAAVAIYRAFFIAALARISKENRLFNLIEHTNQLNSVLISSSDDNIEVNIRSCLSGRENTESTEQC